MRGILISREALVKRFVVKFSSCHPAFNLNLNWKIARSIQLSPRTAAAIDPRASPTDP
jgi:hypothetical protein